MSRCEAWPLLFRLFLSALLANADAPVGWLEDAGVRDVKEDCVGEAELSSEDEKPGFLLWCVWSSAFRLTPLLWAPAADPIMAHSLVWSTDTTTEWDEVDDDEGCRTSMSSWAENFNSRLWMHACLAVDSLCDKQRKHKKLWKQ